MPYPKGLSLYTIWDEIVCFLESTKDLLSLALTCHIFKELIIPDHLEYRSISCDIRNKTVWKFLESRPRLARGVRFIELIQEPTEDVCVPRDLRNIYFSLNHKVPVTEEDTVLFRNALSHATSLKEFTWRQHISPIQAFIDVSDTLTSLIPCLEGVSFKFSRSLSHADKARLENLSIWKLTSLKRAVVYTPGQAAIQMILSCPNIEDLCLQPISVAFTSHLMRHANWKNLRRLSISMFQMANLPHLELVEDENPWMSEIITSFFEHHSNLEYLSLYLSGVPIDKLPSSCLPKLRSLEWHDEDISMGSFLSDNITSRLVYLHCWDRHLDSNSLPQMDELESFYLSVLNGGHLPKSFTSFAVKAPNLKKICLESSGHGVMCARGSTQEAFIEALLQFSTLTHVLCNIPIEGTRLQETLEYLCERLSPLPDLQYMEIVVDSHKRVLVKLERDENGTYSGYQFVSCKEFGRNSYNLWGNFLDRLSH